MVRRRPSSARWLKEHREDPYVAASKRDGYRSRAAYKLLELQEFPKTHAQFGTSGSPLIKSGMTVVDLGAAPGGWAQVAAQLVGKQGKVVAADLLPIKPLVNVVRVQGDFLEQKIMDTIQSELGEQGQADIILSDMAPNMTGIRCADQSQGDLLAECAFEFSATVLKPNGSLVLKIFQGSGFHSLVQKSKKLFKRVKIIKPAASRDRSSEHYLLGLGFYGVKNNLT